MKSYAEHFISYRRDVSEQARQYASGLMQAGSRKNIYAISEVGFNAQDLKRVVAYLQKEIRANRRNVGALKLSNLLQLNRFEEDLNISNVRLRSAPPPQSPRSTPTDRRHLRPPNSRTCVR